MLKTRKMIVKKTPHSNFRIQGKSTKELKEAFIELRASFQYVNKQLSEARSARDEAQAAERLSKSILEKNLKNHQKELQKVCEEFEHLKSKSSAALSEVRLENRRLRSKIKQTEESLQNSRELSGKHSRTSYARRAHNVKLREEIVDLKKLLKIAERSLKREQQKRIPKTRKVYKTKTNIVTRVVKEPLPDKIRQLTHDGVTRTKIDYIAIVTALLRFSDKTKLTVRQCLMLLEASNFEYFKHEFLINQSSFCLRELEAKGLISGDRTFTKKAVGWFLTPKGKRVVSLLYKRLYDNHKIKKEYVKDEHS